jgi:hypothetical protein
VAETRSARALAALKAEAAELATRVARIQELADQVVAGSEQERLRLDLRRVIPRGSEVLTVVRPPADGQSEVRLFYRNRRDETVEVTTAVADLLDLALAEHDEGASIALPATTIDPANTVVTQLSRALHRRPGALHHSELTNVA